MPALPEFSSEPLIKKSQSDKKIKSNSKAVQKLESASFNKIQKIEKQWKQFQMNSTAIFSKELDKPMKGSQRNTLTNYLSRVDIRRQSNAINARTQKVKNRRQEQKN